MNITYLTPPDNTCNPGRVADGAVASEPPDADVVVLVWQVDLVQHRGRRGLGCVPVEVGDGSYKHEVFKVEIKKSVLKGK